MARGEGGRSWSVRVGESVGNGFRKPIRAVWRTRGL